MSSKRRGESTAPALFPFLAVLLCTIGALVLILVLTVANSHASAKREVENEISKVAETTSEMEIVAEELAVQRDELKARVERRRRDLADIEDHISRLSQTLENLVSKIERIQTQSSQTEEERTGKTEQIAKLKTEIDQKKRELIDEIEKQKKRKPAFAVIPYVGTNGTNRRPVYLECTKEGVIVQPEGLLISLNDLRPPFGPGNPLDAALRVLRLAYQQKDATFGITLPPYPLLIVRPDGIQTYALAREAMSGWDDQFGYELVEKEMELKFPASPAGLREQLTSTVELAKRRQQALIAALPRRISAPDGEDSWDGIDASSSASTGTSTGNYPADGSSGSNLASNDNSQQEWKLVQGIANSQITGAIQRNGMASQDSGQASAGPGGPVGTGLPPSASNSNSFSSSGKTLPGHFTVSNNSSGAASGANMGTQKTTGAGTETTNSESTNAGSTNASQNVATNSVNNTGGGDTNGTDAAASGNAGAGGSGANAGSNSMANNASGSNNGTSTSNTPAPPGANAFSSGTATGGASGMASAGGPTQGQSDPNASPNLSLSVNQKPDNSPAKAKHVRAEGDVKPISVSAGHGWAASRAEGKATPVSRPINIVALKDRWLLRSDVEPGKFEANLTMEEGPQKAGEQLALAMRKRVDSWGIAVVGGYWSPSLTIEAASDAQQSVARLERLLEGSGVEIKVVPLTLPNRR
jgi:hypothetical protein